MASLVICCLFQFVDSLDSNIDRKKVFLEKLPKLGSYHDKKYTSSGLFMEYFFGPLQNTTTSSKKEKGSKNLILVV